MYPVTCLIYRKPGSSGTDDMLGALVNYACHGTVLPRTNSLLTADYVGYVIKSMEERYPPLKGKFVYFNGPCGEINPLTSVLAEKLKKIHSVDELSNDDIYDQQGTWEDAERIGSTIASAALANFDKLSFSDYSTQAVQLQNIRIAIKPYKYGNDIASIIPRLVYHLKKFLFSKFVKLGMLRSSILLDTDTLARGYVEAQIQLIDLGGILIYTAPGEYFLSLANEVISHSKKEIPKIPSFMVELANYSVGYLYSIEAYLKGGYESSFSLTPMGGRYVTWKLKQLISKYKK